MSVPCLTPGESTRLVLIIVVRTAIIYLLLYFSPFISTNEWNWFESLFFLSSRILINVFSSNCFWLHQLWILAHTYQRVRAVAMVQPISISRQCTHSSPYFSRLMMITGVLTLILAVSFLWVTQTSRSPFYHSRIYSFLFPDSPTNAWFFTEDERAKAVRRIKVCNRTSICIFGLSMNDEGKPNGS